MTTEMSIALLAVPDTGPVMSLDEIVSKITRQALRLRPVGDEEP